jgi:MYXO-CTERM domain-containing protein
MKSLFLAALLLPSIALASPARFDGQRVRMTDAVVVDASTGDCHAGASTGLWVGIAMLGLLAHRRR